MFKIIEYGKKYGKNVWDAALAPAYSPAHILFKHKKYLSIEEQNASLKERINALDAELQKYGKKAIEEYMANERYEETLDMQTRISMMHGFKYTHAAAELRIEMLEKKLDKLQAYASAGWEAYNRLEANWRKFLLEHEG